MTSQDPWRQNRTLSKITMEMCGRVWERDATESRAGGPFAFSWHFSDCSPAFPCLTVSFFLSFFLRLRGFCCSFLFLSHFSFCLCSCTGISALLWLASRFPSPLFPPLNMSFPWKNTHAWRVLTAGWFLRHMYSLTKWKCDTDAVMSEYKRPTVASLLSRRLCCWRTASQQLIDPATLADAKLESTLTTENNKNLHYLIADLNSCVKLALPCELTRQNRHVHADLPRRRTTTRSPMVRLNSKLSKATLTSRTGKIRRQNIRLNSCSLT